jgi:DNA ligase-3
MTVKFSVDYSKRVSKCQRCKNELEKGSLRLAKLVPNPFHDDSGEMKSYYHVDCLFDSFKNARATTKIIESADDIDSFGSIEEKDKKAIIKKIDNLEKLRSDKKPSKIVPKQSKLVLVKLKEEKEQETDHMNSEDEMEKMKTKKPRIEPIETDKESEDEEDDSEDNLLKTFEKITDRIANESSHLKKTAILKKFFEEGIEGEKYNGNMYLFIKLLLPNTTTRVYNLNSKQILKLFSKIFNTNLDQMNDHLNNKGDVSETCKHFFHKSIKIKPQTESSLTLEQVDEYLDKLSNITKENEQLEMLTKIAKKCTTKNLVTMIRLIKKDLRIDAGEKIVLDSLSPNAYAAFQTSRNLKEIIQKIKYLKKNANKPNMKKDLSSHIDLMTPVKPMLAEACKTIERAFEKCPNGIYAEIKYDGERLQLHKKGSKFDYFSRHLKKVSPHKVEYLKEYIPKAFPNAKDLILDGEILLYDTNTEKPLPFGTLGVHKVSSK